MGLRIEATPVGGGQLFIIADGTNARGAGGKLAVDVEANAIQVATFDCAVQEVALLRGSQIQRFDRKNEFGDMPVRVQYEFDTIRAAFEYFMDLQHKVPRLADITLTDDGASRILANVALRPLRARRGGVLVTVDYPIRFGLVANPTSGT